ncbi:MAG: amidase [Alphaproteobacteria bacterium]|nr:amidase [Alphaproteobacteria bacterium]
MAIPDFTESSIASLSDALRSGRITALGIAERVIENYEKYDSAFHAYKTWEPEALKAQAQVADAAFAADLDFGPLQGLPVSVKDLYGVSGYPTFAGTPKQLPEKWQSEGPVVATLRHGLAAVTGKTHTVEFAFGGVGTNAHWGAPFNPWDAERHRAPGGSSAGAGVSLWAGTAVVALGSDTAGSVRIPAAVTGTVGVKTSIHRWSVDGIVPLSPSLDTAGALTRTAADAAVAFAAVDPLVAEHPLAFAEALQATDIAGLRVGLCDWFFDSCGAGITETVLHALEELQGHGVDAVSIDLPEIAACHDIFKRGGLAAAEFAAFINTEMQDYKATLDPNVAARFERMEAIPAIDYLSRRNALDRLAGRIAGRLADVDVLVTPTVPITPPDLATIDTGDSYFTANMGMLRNTAAVNLLRLCAVTIPAGLDAATMPVGLQIIAPFGEDERALAVACAFERVLGTARERLGTPPRLDA